jgi:hypothetical protein
MARSELFRRTPERLPPCFDGEKVTYPKDGKKWLFHDHSFSHYMEDFEKVDRGKVAVLLSRLSRINQPVVIDLMASTAAIRDLRQRVLRMPQFKGLAVSLFDRRSEEETARDDFLGISHLAGDLNNFRGMRTWDRISDWLGKDRAHLIMERGFGGLHHIPTRLIYFRAVMSRMWKMLDPNGGMLLLQTPPRDFLRRRGIPINRWLGRLRRAGIYRQFIGSYRSRDAGIRYGLLQVIKETDCSLPDVF